MKNIIIIGGGIAGLSAGCYLQKHGFKTQIFEQHSLPGGLCTSWQRKGYTFDACIHWLVGTNKTDSFYKYWNEIIKMEDIYFYEDEEFFRLFDKDNNQLIVYRNIDRFEKTLLSIATDKGDMKLISEFAAATRKLLNFNLPSDKAPELISFMDSLKMFIKIFPFMGTFNKWNKISAGDFASKFKNPLIKKLFQTLFMPEFPVFFILFMFVWFTKKNAGYPIGGSLNFAKLLEKNFVANKGIITYNSKVEKIITENGNAKGVITNKGETHYTDIVISASDGFNTIFNMLEGKYVNKKIENIYKNYKVFPSFLQVSFGIDAKLNNMPGTCGYILEKDLTIDDKTTTDTIGFRIFNFDPTLAPDGKTSVIATLNTYNYEYWVKLKIENPDKYKAEKQRIADELAEIFITKTGISKEQIEVTDVSTPSTVIRYTGNWKGSFEGWIITPGMGFKSLSKILPGLNNFYLIGQWVEPGGGLPACILSARNLTQIICKKANISFNP
ncbi:MAG: NAD(P)/FAD-dependent oxidoreductase [Bacteroidales bacterium]|nr:NAD(P)/FAD-dependent oxidoreductase [Bacteroidales bacterium]